VACSDLHAHSNPQDRGRLGQSQAGVEHQIDRVHIPLPAPALEVDQTGWHGADQPQEFDDWLSRSRAGAEIVTRGHSNPWVGSSSRNPARMPHKQKRRLP